MHLTVALFLRNVIIFFIFNILNNMLYYCCSLFYNVVKLSAKKLDYWTVRNRIH